MRFLGILFPDDEGSYPRKDQATPDFFRDLNLDQIVDAITAGKDEYDPKPFFHVSLADIGTIHFRQEVFRDVEDHHVHAVVTAYGSAMRTMRLRLDVASKRHYRYEKQRWFLDAVAAYCSAVTTLGTDLAAAEPASRGMASVLDYLAAYTRRQDFRCLCSETRELLDDLAGVRYNLLVKGNKITVGGYDAEADYSEQVLTTFERFRRGRVADYRIQLSGQGEMGHVEAGILDLVAKLQPEPFARLAAFCSRNGGFRDSTVVRLDRELQFYLGYLDYLSPIRKAGLAVCYPQVSTDAKEEHAERTFDLALASKLVGTEDSVVCNDFLLTGDERILVVSGPNQGGKTTLARTFGQLHYFSSLGCPVPGSDVRVFVPDLILTHFEREEELETLAGKLEDELLRIHSILERATQSSLIIMNEIFTSTTLQDALFLSKEVLGRLTDLDALCVCVTFLDELSTLNDKTVSMVATIVPEDPTVRTFTLVRKPADGRAYALAIAEKYGLGYDSLKGRVLS